MKGMNEPEVGEKKDRQKGRGIEPNRVRAGGK